MRQPRIPVSPTEPDYQHYDPPLVAGPLPGDERADRPRLTERIAGWSAGHRKTVVIGWLLPAALALLGHRAWGRPRDAENTADVPRSALVPDGR